MLVNTDCSDATVGLGLYKTGLTITLKDNTTTKYILSTGGLGLFLLLPKVLSLPIEESSVGLYHLVAVIRDNKEGDKLRRFLRTARCGALQTDCPQTN